MTSNVDDMSVISQLSYLVCSWHVSLLHFFAIRIIFISQLCGYVLRH